MPMASSLEAEGGGVSLESATGKGSVPPTAPEVLTLFRQLASVAKIRT